MEASRLLTCLSADYERLREVAASDLAATVPNCPGWTMADLVRHVAEVYLHKSACMRLHAPPDPWPPAGLADEEPMVLLERSWATLAEDFASRDPEDSAFTWYEPDRTVGFWIRRMAQETVIHRVDAEQAAGRTITTVPDDLAEDGIDELLRCFLEYGSRRWHQEFVDAFATIKGRAVQVVSADRSWLVWADRDAIHVDEASESGRPPDAVLRGRPHDVLLRLWHRETDDAVLISGDPAALDELRTLTSIATQ